MLACVLFACGRAVVPTKLLAERVSSDSEFYVLDIVPRMLAQLIIDR
jgi:hypothetical protein